MPNSTFLRFSGGPVFEWHDVNYLKPARSHRRTLTALVMVVVIALLDLCMRSSYSILYIGPIILLAQDEKPLLLWRTAAGMVALIYGVFVLKNVVNPPPVEWGYFDIRLVNRTFAAIMILALSQILKSWIRWRTAQSDAEISDSVCYQDREISETLALLCSVPMVIVIATIDFVSPAQYNLAILYPIPLVVCGWTRSRGLVWAMLAVLMVLAVAAFVLGPPATVPDLNFGMQRSRFLAMIAMAIVAATLHQWMQRGAFESA